MKKTFFVLIMVGLLAGSIGCGKDEEQAQPASSDPRARLISMSPSQQGVVESSGNTASGNAKLSPLVSSQKEYLDSYNEYVRLLRESGPQTIETLQALAIYQKKYQIYQMLLKAQGDKIP